MTARGGTPATTALTRAGIAFVRHEYDFEPGSDGIGLQAAAALGVAPERLLKTLIVELDTQRLGMALLAVDRSLDLKAAARAFGAKRSAMASVPTAERATGYVKGGISPFGQKRRLPGVVDASALRSPTVLVNGGRRGLQLELAPAALVEALAALVADLTQS